ncbi:hypothetical protein D3C73_1447250 [compost metagenome]
MATRPAARRAAGMDPAMSTWAMIQPPKTSPWIFASAGIGMTRNTASRLAGKVVNGDLGLEVMRPTPMHGNQPIMQEKRDSGVRGASRHGALPRRLGNQVANFTIP